MGVPLTRLRLEQDSSQPSTPSLACITFQPYAPPFLRLPSELLSYILEIVASSSVEYDPREVPVTLSQICSKLRVIALSTGPIWSRVYMTLPYSPMDLCHLRIQLARSKQCALEVIVDYHDHDWDFDEECMFPSIEDFRSVINALIPTAPRWRSLVLRLDTWRPMHRFLLDSLSVPSMHLLTSLTLVRCNGFHAARGLPFSPSELRDPIPLFNGLPLPSLRKLKLVGVHVDFPTSSFSGLTSLKFQYHSADVMPSVSTFVAILADSPALQSLSILGWGPIMDSHVEHHSVVLRQLQSFAFGLVDEGYAIHLLSLFSMPALRRLTIEDITPTVSAHDRADASLVVAFFIQQQEHGYAAVPPYPLHRVEDLTVDWIEVDEGQMRDLLEKFSDVKHLNLVHIPRQSLQILAPSDRFVCARLEEVTCRDVEIEILAEVIRQRKQHDEHSPITKVTFKGCREAPGPDEIQAVEEMLKEVGVEFEHDVE